MSRAVRCVVCEEIVSHGEFFFLPTEDSELSRFAAGLFPTKPDECVMFMDHIRQLKSIPYVCLAHFARKDIINNVGTLRLGPSAIPKMYEGSMRIRMEKFRRKCIVCGALRPSIEMYPFTQKTQLATIWCEKLHPNESRLNGKLLNKVMNAVAPTLCGEHFSRSCFDDARDLRPNSVPTMAKVSTTANVMNILNKAKDDLQRVLPGNFIPRDDVWTKVDEEAGFSSRFTKPTSERSINTRGSDEKEESPVLFDNSLSDKVQKEEEIEIIGERMEWDQAGPSMTMEEELASPPDEHHLRKRAGQSKDAGAPIRNGSRTVRVPSPEVLEGRTRAVAADHSAVTTRSGRIVRRKTDYDEPMRNGKTKRSTRADTDPSNSSLSRSIDPIMDLFFPDRNSKVAEQAASSATKKSRVVVNQAEALSQSSTKVQGQLPVRKIRARLQAQMIRCSMCRGSAEATIFGMKEHAREHCDHSLKCPFNDCPVSFTANKRSKVSYHTQTIHRRWALPIDLCDQDEALENNITTTMRRCFPCAMNRANEPGSVPCMICSFVVSPDYRSLYSHACLHLPSRPYVCSECATFEAYTEEEIEEHHQQENCRGDVVSNMDDAISSLAEKIFKTAFPAYAHLVEDTRPLDVEFQGNSFLVDQELPCVDNDKLGTSLVYGSYDEVKKEEDKKMVDFPSSILPGNVVRILDMVYANPRLEEKKKEINSVDHDHCYRSSTDVFDLGKNNARNF